MQHTEIGRLRWMRAVNYRVVRDQFQVLAKCRGDDDQIKGISTEVEVVAQIDNILRDGLLDECTKVKSLRRNSEKLVESLIEPPVLILSEISQSTADGI